MQSAPTSELRGKVCEAYSAVATSPAEEHLFPVGRAIAESLGYPAALLETSPQAAVDAFAGVSNVSMIAEIPEGATVLDLGCGAGLDSLIAAGRAGRSGRVIGVDFSDTMLERAREAAQEAAVPNITFEHEGAEHLPLDDACIDVAIVNGIFNLNPAPEFIFSELARVLRRGGVAYSAELILASPLPPNIRPIESDWFA